MKKNPIDELFAEKLAGHEQVPSSRALERFNERLQERHAKKRAGFIPMNRQWFYYGMAASIFIVASFLLIRLSDQPTQKTVQISSKTAISTKETLNPPTEKSEVSHPTLAFQASLSPKRKTLTRSTQKPMEETTIVQPMVQEQVSKPMEEQAQVIQNEVPAMLENKKTITAPETPVLAINSEKKEKADILLVLTETHEEVSAKEQTSNEATEKPLLKRFWTELKHLQKGEKVDLSMLKGKPKEIMVKADESFFKEEREDMQESWHRLKSRISKKEF